MYVKAHFPWISILHTTSSRPVCLHASHCSRPSGSLDRSSVVRTLHSSCKLSLLNGLSLPKGHSSPPGLCHKPPGSCPFIVGSSWVPGLHTAGWDCGRVYENGMAKRQSLPGTLKSGKVTKAKQPSGFWNEMLKQAQLASFFFKRLNDKNDGSLFKTSAQSVARSTASGLAHQAGFGMHAANIFWSPYCGDKMNDFLSYWQNILDISSKEAGLDLHIKLI